MKWQEKKLFIVWLTSKWNCHISPIQDSKDIDNILTLKTGVNEHIVSFYDMFKVHVLEKPL